MGQSCTKEPTTSRLKSVDAEASRKRVRRAAKGSQRRDSTAKPTATDTGAMNCLESPPDSSEEVSAEPVVVDVSHEGNPLEEHSLAAAHAKA